MNHSLAVHQMSLRLATVRDRCAFHLILVGRQIAFTGWSYIYSFIVLSHGHVTSGLPF